MRHVLDLAQQQANSGQQVHIIYSRQRLEPLFAPQLRELKHITLHELPMRRAPHPGDIGNLYKLIRLLRDIKPDILHAHSTKAGMLARLARLFLKTKVIYSPHAFMTMNPDTSVWLRGFYSIYERLAAPLTDRVMVLSDQEFQHARALGIPEKRIAFGAAGIAPLPMSDRNPIRAAWNVPADAVLIGFVGRFTHQKYPELAIEAFAAAQKNFPQLYLVMIGDGELLPHCRALAQKLNVADRVIFAGAIDARTHYAGMDILLITSRYENMAYTLIESLFAGLPVVTTEVGISRRCVHDGQNGYIVLPEAEQMGAALGRLAADAPLRDAMRFAARAAARDFSLQQMNQHYQKTYDAI